MASPLAELAKIWPTLSQKHHSRDERRFYIEWLVVALLALSTLSVFTLMG